jgi:hypothetical protein
MELSRSWTKELERKLKVDDLGDELILRDIDLIFETARSENCSCGEMIGGPIDVAVIESEGVRWLRKKAASAH